MRGQIRLAERAGLLTGVDISPVQFKANVVLQYLEDKALADQERFDLKRSLISTGLYDPEKMFPEYFILPVVETEEEEEQAESAGQVLDYDYKGVKWMSPSEAKDEYAGLLEQMLKGENKGSLTGDQVVVRETFSEWV